MARQHPRGRGVIIDTPPHISYPSKIKSSVCPSVRRRLGYNRTINAKMRTRKKWPPGSYLDETSSDAILPSDAEQTIRFGVSSMTTRNLISSKYYFSTQLLKKKKNRQILQQQRSRPFEGGVLFFRQKTPWRSLSDPQKRCNPKNSIFIVQRPIFIGVSIP